MIKAQQFKTDMSKILDDLPESKIIELMDFANFLRNQYAPSKTAVDESSLMIQQESLKNIWDNPEEDIYEL